MSIFRKIDSYFYAQSQGMFDADTAIKPHSAFTLITLGLSQFLVPLMTANIWELPYHTGTAVLVILAFAIVCLFVMTLFAWRGFFRMRRQGLNHDRNIFLAESAGTVRRWVFYVAFITYLIFRASGLAQAGVEDMQYMLRADFYMAIASSAITGTALSVIFIEALRLFSPKMDRWSSRRHMFVVLAVALGYLVFQISVLIRVRGIPVV